MELYRLGWSADNSKKEMRHEEGSVNGNLITDSFLFSLFQKYILDLTMDSASAQARSIFLELKDSKFIRTKKKGLHKPGKN